MVFFETLAKQCYAVLEPKRKRAVDYYLRSLILERKSLWLFFSQQFCSNLGHFVHWVLRDRIILVMGG